MIFTQAYWLSFFRLSHEDEFLATYQNRQEHVPDKNDQIKSIKQNISSKYSI